MRTVFAAFFTIVTGVAVYVVGLLVKSIFVDPIMEQRKVIGEIDYNLFYLANIYSHPVGSDDFGKLPEEGQKAMLKAADTLRQCAGRLRATTNTIVRYDTFAGRGWVPRRGDVDEAVRELTYLANAQGSGSPDERKEIKQARTKICRLLRLPEL